MLSSSRERLVSSSSSKSSISKSSAPESIIVMMEVSLALIPSAITVPFLTTSPSSTFNSPTFAKVCNSPGLTVIS